MKLRNLPRILVAMLAIVTFATAACGAENAQRPASTTSSSTPEESSTTTSLASGTATCTAETFTVEYPENWSMNSESDGGPCEYFHPEPFEVPKDSEAVGIAVHLRHQDVDFDFVSDPENNSEEVLDYERTDIDGVPAVRMRTCSTQVWRRWHGSWTPAPRPSPQPHTESPRAASRPTQLFSTR